MLFRKTIVAVTAVLPLFAAAPAMAHPHVWVAARATVLFDKEGQITGVRHVWTFDEMYSAFATQGLGKDGKPPTREELQPLAKTNVDSLAEFDYFTFAREAGKKLPFQEPSDFWLDADEKKIVSLHFTVLLKQPIAAKKAFSFQVYDPTYFVAFGFEKTEPIALKDAPSGCSASVMTPPPLLAAESQRLSAAATENFSPGADLSSRLAPRVVVACP
ncbi:MAG: DUF1007 family protein [Methylobacteriaceae bacterium]|nr:DUF1007 family protein [Methylobacteriaceae bacterium]